MRSVLAVFFALGLGFLVACSQRAQPSTPADAVAAFESAHFTLSVSGVGPDLILVPGLASSAAVWDGTVEALQDRFRLHVVQVSGFGGADPRGNAANGTVLEDLATDLVRYASSLEAAPTLIGHSLGGLVALKAGLQETSLFKRIVIVDVLPFFSVLMDKSATVDTMRPVSEIMKAALLRQSEEAFARQQAEALSALVKSEPDLQKALAWSLSSDREVMAQAMSEVLVTDLRDQISRIESPVTVIYAKDNTIPDMAGVETLYRDLYQPLQDGTLIPIEDALHFIPLDQPEAFLAALKGALATE